MVIESINEFEMFFEIYKNNDVILIPVLCDAKKHAAGNELSFIFIKILHANQYFILPFNHNECVNLDHSYIDKLMCNNKKYVFDKKTVMHILPLSNLIDINLLNYLRFNSSLEFESISQTTSSHSLIYRLLDDVKNINRAIPVLKFYEKLVNASNKLEEIVNISGLIEKEQSFTFLNDDTITCLQKIEKEGLFVDKAEMIKYFPQSKSHITSNNLIYTEYNIYTATGRPANRFGNINFAALNKDNGERACFKTRFGSEGKLIVFDYDAYHFALMADMVGYEFPPGINIHTYLGKIYFDKDVLTQEEYNQSKEISFQFAYGGIDKSIADAIPFFSKIRDFTNDVWNIAQKIGYIETIVSKKKIWLSNFDSLNKNKLFNYLLQNYETEQNIITIKQIQNFMSGMKSKLVLYLYDGFLFDVNLCEIGIENELKTILQREGKFTVKTQTGYDFHNLVKIE